MRIILIPLYLIFIALLIPWIPVAFWFGNFLNDAVTSSSASALMSPRYAIYLVVLLYPVFVVYGAVSGWYFSRTRASKSVIYLNALLPLFPILLMLFGIVLLGIF